MTKIPILLDRDTKVALDRFMANKKFTSYDQCILYLALGCLIEESKDEEVQDDP